MTREFIPDCPDCKREAGTEPKFVAIAKTVMRTGQCIAVACSHTMAKRIARALNLHKPNERGY